MSTIFYIDDNNRAVQLHEEKYESEDLLQYLIEQYPAVLAGDQINPERPRKWILISREMGVPSHEGGSDQWFLDHLLIDQDGIPTFVEVKRSTDTRIRREVVAQMLDYAANATAYWPVTRLRQVFEQYFDNPSEALHERLEIPLGEEDIYWEKVGTNLRLGKLRLLFVADEIPASLQRIIEFLNNQMTDTEVLGVEIKQYVSDTKQRTLVPKLLGRTTASVQIKKSPSFVWTEELFLEKVFSSSGESARYICEKLLVDFKQMGCLIQWGRGTVQVGFTPVYKKHRLCPVYTFKNCTTIEMPFCELKPPFDTEEKKNTLITKFNQIPQLKISENPKRPSFDCNILISDDAYNQFIEICQEMIDEIKRFES